MDEGEGQPERLWDLARLILRDSTPTLHTRLTLRENLYPLKDWDLRGVRLGRGGWWRGGVAGGGATS